MVIGALLLRVGGRAFLVSFLGLDAVAELGIGDSIDQVLQKAGLLEVQQLCQYAMEDLETLVGEDTWQATIFGEFGLPDVEAILARERVEQAQVEVTARLEPHEDLLEVRGDLGDVRDLRPSPGGRRGAL